MKWPQQLSDNTTLQPVLICVTVIFPLTEYSEWALYWSLEICGTITAMEQSSWGLNPSESVNMIANHASWCRRHQQNDMNGWMDWKDEMFWSCDCHWKVFSSAIHAQTWDESKKTTILRVVIYSCVRSCGLHKWTLVIIRTSFSKHWITATWWWRFLRKRPSQRVSLILRARSCAQSGKTKEERCRTREKMCTGEHLTDKYESISKSLD